MAGEAGDAASTLLSSDRDPPINKISKMARDSTFRPETAIETEVNCLTNDGQGFIIFVFALAVMRWRIVLYRIMTFPRVTRKSASNNHPKIPSRMT
jgi:hypothetical protein